VGNWIQDHPAMSIVTHTLLVATATAGAFIFVFDSNKVTAAKAEADQYKAKTETLEAQIAGLKDENKKYLEWLESDPKTFPSLEAKIASLTEANRKLQEQADVGKVTPNMSTSEGKAAVITIGETFVDDLTGVSFGLSGISSSYTVNGQLTFPSGESKSILAAQPGTAWGFVFKGERYQIQLRNVDWYSNKVTIAVGPAPKDK
jgi:hypothetical protein